MNFWCEILKRTMTPQKGLNSWINTTVGKLLKRRVQYWLLSLRPSNEHSVLNIFLANGIALFPVIEAVQDYNHLFKYGFGRQPVKINISVLKSSVS